MKIQPITFTGYKINTKDNKQVKFLYNKSYDILTQEQQTITFARDFIKFDRLTKKMKLALEELKIKWKEEK